MYIDLCTFIVVQTNTAKYQVSVKHTTANILDYCISVWVHIALPDNYIGFVSICKDLRVLSLPADIRKNECILLMAHGRRPPTEAENTQTSLCYNRN